MGQIKNIKLHIVTDIKSVERHNVLEYHNIQDGVLHKNFVFAFLLL